MPSSKQFSARASWTDAGLSAGHSTRSHREESARDIYLDLGICSQGRLQGLLEEELKKRWEHFLWYSFLQGCEKLQGSVRSGFSNDIEKERKEENV